MRRILSLMLALTFVVALAGCSTSAEEKEQAAKDEDKKEEKAAEAAKAVDTYKPKLICPQVAILHELETVRDYGGAKPDRAQLMAASRMTTIDGDCSYKDNGIDINFTLHFLAAKGPRLGNNKATFPFFIAVVDPNEAILNKDQMSASFRFKEDEKISEHDEPLHVFIPLPKDKNSTGPNYRVLAGFQLTQDQLTEIRKEEEAKVNAVHP